MRSCPRIATNGEISSRIPKFGYLIFVNPLSIKHIHGYDTHKTVRIWIQGKPVILRRIAGLASGAPGANFGIRVYIEIAAVGLTPLRDSLS